MPVLGGELVVNLDADGDVLSAGGETLPAGHVATSPRVGSGTARDTAVAAVSKWHEVSGARLDATMPERWIYDAQLLGGPGPDQPVLTWRVEVVGRGTEPVNELVLVDAKTGSIALHIDQIQDVKQRSVCDANNSASQLPCFAPVRTEGGPATGVADVDHAYDFAGDTYDFFAGFGRDSLDGKGLPLKSTVRYCDPGAPCPYQNAFWNGEQMVYGSGFAAADDVVAHELTHGVTDFSAHLFYYFQSGAINESLSDVFGEFVDQTNGEGNDTPEVKWQLGEDIPGLGAGRDMENPPAFGDPDKMTSPNYTADPNELDNGGVHTNSGVNNKAAFLITDGGTFNGRTVAGIGIPKASRIYYEVQIAMLTSGSDYADLASALPQACTNLIGTAGITAANCSEVAKAVAAVEMNTDPPAARAPQAPAAECPSGLVRTDLLREGFERLPNANWGSTGGWGFETAYAHSGRNSLYGNDPAFAADTFAGMMSSVVIPSNASSAFLRFDHAYGFEDSSTGVTFDGGVVEVSTDGGRSWTDIGDRLTDVGYNGTIATGGGNPLGGRPAFVGESNGYRASRANLDTLKGKAVRFRFRIGTDNQVGALGWVIDDVHLYSCAPPPPVVTPPVVTPPPSGGGTNPPAVTLRSARVRSCKTKGKGRKLQVRCRLRSFGAVRRVRIKVVRKGKTVARGSAKPSRNGTLTLKPRKRLKRGSYKVTITLLGASGAKRNVTAKLRVR